MRSLVILIPPCSTSQPAPCIPITILGVLGTMLTLTAPTTTLLKFLLFEIMAGCAQAQARFYGAIWLPEGLGRQKAFEGVIS